MITTDKKRLGGSVKLEKNHQRERITFIELGLTVSKRIFNRAISGL